MLGGYGSVMPTSYKNLFPLFSSPSGSINLPAGAPIPAGQEWHRLALGLYRSSIGRLFPAAKVRPDENQGAYRYPPIVQAA